MGHRLFLPAPLHIGEVRTLDAERGHYISRVLRLKHGDSFSCFDGSGQEFVAEVAAARGKSVTVQIGALLRIQPQPPATLHLAIGWLKGQAMDTVVQKATELGVSELWPIAASRSNVRISPQRTAGRLAHWRKIATHAAEQSARLQVPTVHEPVTLAEYLDTNQTLDTVMLHPGHEPMDTDLPHGALALLVGPEGGWTADELAAGIAAGASVHGLGELVLRAETAPIAALACVHQLRGWR